MAVARSALVLFLLALCLVAHSAPAPFVRPGKGVEGAWQAHQGAVRVTLGKDGSYAESWHRIPFVGRWKGDGETIRVTCRPVPDQGDPPFVFRLVRKGRALEMEPYSTVLERVP